MTIKRKRKKLTKEEKAVRFRKSKIGTIKGLMTIIDVTDKRVLWKNGKSFSYRYKLKCVCGNVVERPISGWTYSCGCIERDPNHEGNDRIAAYIKTTRNGAYKRGLTFEVTRSDLVDLLIKQDYKCTYTDLPLTFGSREKRTASLDRIDSNKGYIKGNVHWVHKKVNTIKWDLGEEEFIQMCKLVAKHAKKRKAS